MQTKSQKRCIFFSHLSFICSGRQYRKIGSLFQTAKACYDLQLPNSEFFIPDCLKNIGTTTTTTTKKKSLVFLHQDPPLLFLLRGMLHIDDEKRISMKEVKNFLLDYFFNKMEFHCFFKDLFFEKNSEISKLKINEWLMASYESIHKKRFFISAKAKATAKAKVNPSFFPSPVMIICDKSGKCSTTSSRFIQRKEFISHILVLNNKFSSIALLIQGLLLFDLSYGIWKKHLNSLNSKYLACAVFYICYFLYDNSEILSFISLLQCLAPEHSYPLTKSVYSKISLSILLLVIKILFFFHLMFSIFQPSKRN